MSIINQATEIDLDPEIIEGAHIRESREAVLIPWTVLASTSTRTPVVILKTYNPKETAQQFREIADRLDPPAKRDGLVAIVEDIK